MLIVAAGMRGLVDADYIRPGATGIDVGLHRTDHGITGDVILDEVAEVADLSTPVPGGVGPMRSRCSSQHALRAELQWFDLGAPAAIA